MMSNAYRGKVARSRSAVRDYPQTSKAGLEAAFPAVLHIRIAEWAGSCFTGSSTRVPQAITGRPLCRIRRQEHPQQPQPALPDWMHR
jgi:hypothetical protein